MGLDTVSVVRNLRSARSSSELVVLPSSSQAKKQGRFLDQDDAPSIPYYKAATFRKGRPEEGRQAGAI